MQVMFISLEMSYWHILKFKLFQSSFRSFARQLSDQSLAASSALSPIVCVCVCVCESAQDFQELETHIIWAVGTESVYFAITAYFLKRKKKNLEKVVK